MGSIPGQLGKGLQVWGVPPPSGFYTVHSETLAQIRAWHFGTIILAAK